MTTVELAGRLIQRARSDIAGRTTANRFLDLLEAGEVPRERLGRFAGEQHRIIGSDRRSFALLASRYPQSPAVDMFLGLAEGEGRALELLEDFAAALGWDQADLKAYEPRPWAQAYPAYLACAAVYGTSSAVALAVLVNLDEWGSYCARAERALRTRYDLPEEAVAFFRFFAQPPPHLAEQAAAVIAAGLDGREDPGEAMRATRTLHAYETAFWDSLLEDLS